MPQAQALSSMWSKNLYLLRLKIFAKLVLFLLFFCVCAYTQSDKPHPNLSFDITSSLYVPCSNLPNTWCGWSEKYGLNQHLNPICASTCIPDYTNARYFPFAMLHPQAYDLPIINPSAPAFWRDVAPDSVYCDLANSDGYEWTFPIVKASITPSQSFARKVDLAYRLSTPYIRVWLKDPVSGTFECDHHMKLNGENMYSYVRDYPVLEQHDDLWFHVINLPSTEETICFHFVTNVDYGCDRSATFFNWETSGEEPVCVVSGLDCCPDCRKHRKLSH